MKELGFDKNTVIGFSLLAVLFFGYFYYTSKTQQAFEAEKKVKLDSIAKVEAAQRKIDSARLAVDSIRRDSSEKLTAAGNFQTAALGTVQTITVENELMAVTFTNKGGRILQVALKQFKGKSAQQLVLGNSQFDTWSYPINTAPGQSANTDQLFFALDPIQKQGANQIVKFRLAGANGEQIIHQYTIQPNQYMIDGSIQLTGANQLLSGNQVNFTFRTEAELQEQDLKYERQQSRFVYSESGEFDFEHAANGIQESFTKPMNWVGFKQQFFNISIIPQTPFSGVDAKVEVPNDTNVVAQATYALRQSVPAANAVTIPLRFFYGPNDYKLLKSYDLGLENIVDLGSGMFAFVKYLNRWIIMPVFEFLSKFISNFGWVILLLTIFIRLAISPLTYSSYLSGAKMKALRPELDGLRAKHGDDQQAFAMDQMKLFREAGVSPLGGCLPALLQIPIFFALYSFFNSNLLLRGQHFLWADDLSSYDVIARLPFSIPLGFGDHISLFTLTAVITSFLISFYNMSMTPDTGNPAMKYMPYIFPFILLFIFNRLPSGLTWYYTVSNVITLVLQWIIQNYIINHDKIVAQIEENKKKPKGQSKWQERIAAMQEMQKKNAEVQDRVKQLKNKKS